MQSAHAPAEEIMKDDIADKPHVTDAQLSLLEQHYELAPRLEFRREDEPGKTFDSRACRAPIERRYLAGSGANVDDEIRKRQRQCENC